MFVPHFDGHECACESGFWKTDQILTLGLFHFIGLANSYTQILSIHSTITRLGWLVCFSRASFANYINLQLRQYDPWRALHGRRGCGIDPSGNETSLRPSKHVGVYCWHFLDSKLIQTILTESLTHLQLSTHPTPLPPSYPLVHTTRDITVVMKKVVENPAVLAS